MAGRPRLMDDYGGVLNPGLTPRGWGGYRGGIADQIVDNNFALMRRPYIDANDDPCVSIYTGRYTTNKGVRTPMIEKRRVADLVSNGEMMPTTNATSLRKEEWLELDKVVLRAARYRLRAWADLAQMNTFGGFNGMAKLILEHETMSDPGEAIVDMDGLTDGRTDSPLFQLEGLPLPIIHCDFWFDARRLAVSRNSGTPLDTAMGEAGGRRIGEKVEKLTIGNNTGTTYGGNSTQVGGYGRTSKIYGYTTFSNRLTKTNATSPTASGWKPETTQRDINASLLRLRNNKFYGPFMLYTSTDWDTYLDGDYYALATSGMAAPTQTLRQRIKQIDGVQDVRRLDFLFADETDQSQGGPGREDLVGGGGGTFGWPFTMLFVQMTPDVARAVNGMDITTIQWEAVGGLRLNFKIMAIQVPQIRADYYGNCGILVQTTA